MFWAVSVPVSSAIFPPNQGLRNPKKSEQKKCWSFLLTVKEALGQLLWIRVGSVLVKRGENDICLKKVDVGQGNKAQVLCRLQMHSFKYSLSTYYYATGTFLGASDKMVSWMDTSVKSLTSISSRQAQILLRSIPNPDPQKSNGKNVKRFSLTSDVLSNMLAEPGEEPRLLCQVGSFKEKQSHIESEWGATGWDIGDQNTMPAIFGTRFLFLFWFFFRE